jgi:MFS family permease
VCLSVQAATSPLAAYLAQHHNRTHIIGLGAIWWGVATAAVGLSTSYWQLALARAINGVGLAVVLPAIQSVVADSTAEETRGAAFGWLQLTSNSGEMRSVKVLKGCLCCSGHMQGLRSMSQ